jgi:hypothetical protein
MRTYFDPVKSKALDRIAREILVKGGITVDWKNTRMEVPGPEERFIVGIGKPFERRYQIGSDPTLERIARCVNDYVGDLLTERELAEPGYWFGAWADQGILYLDICRCYLDRDDAERAAKRADQIAYYDAETDEAIAVTI